MASLATPRSTSGDRSGGGGVVLRRNNSGGRSRDNRRSTGSGSSSSARHTPRRKSIPLDRLAMLLMEANEISQCLQKQYTFVKEGECDGDDPDAKVKVINQQLGISCIWPVSKLKERLIRMRRLVYQPDTETSSLSADAVFFDPSDQWVKEVIADTYRNSAVASPTGVSGYGGGAGVTSPTCVSPVSGLRRRMHSESDELPRPFDDGSQKAAAEDGSVSSTSELLLHHHQHHHQHHHHHQLQNKDPCGAAIPRAAHHASLKQHQQQHQQLCRTNSELEADTEFLPGESTTRASPSSCTSPSPPSPPPPAASNNSSSSSSSSSGSREEATTSGSGSTAILPERYLTGTGLRLTLPRKNIHGEPNENGKRVNSSTRSSNGGGATGLKRGSRVLSKQDSTRDEPGLREKYLSSSSTGSSNNNGSTRNNNHNITTGSNNSTSRHHATLLNGHHSQQHHHSNPNNNNNNHPAHHGKYNGEEQLSLMVNGSTKGLMEAETLPITATTATATAAVEVHKKKSNVVVEQVDRTCQTILSPTTPALTRCRHLVESIRDRLHNGPDTETLLEKVLYNCECIKVAVINILEAHAQGRDSQHGVDSWSDNDLMRTSAFYLVSALENLTSHFTCWVTSLPESALAESFGSGGGSGSASSASTSSSSCWPPSRQLGCDAGARDGACEEHCNNSSAGGGEPENHLHNAQVVTGAILHSLALDLAILLQFAEQNDDSEVHDTASRVFDHVYDLCRRCGELSIGTEETPTTLWSTHRETIDQLMTLSSATNRHRNDPFRPTPGCDIKQAFLSGSDVTVERTLHDTIQTAADCEKQVRALSSHKDTDESSEDILKHTYVVVATTKVLMQRTMKVQTELGQTVRDEPEQPDSHYNAHYARSVAVLTHASQLSDALTLLGQACTAMVNDSDPSGMRKIGRCGEIVLKSCCRLAAIPGITGEPNEAGGRPRSTTPSSNLNGLLSPRVKGKLCVSLSIDAKSDHPLVAILLSPTQIDGLERAVTDVNTAIMSLLNAIQCHLPADLSSSRSRRMLPVVPARALGRSNSAKHASSSSRRRLTRDLTAMQTRRAHEV